LRGDKSIITTFANEDIEGIMGNTLTDARITFDQLLQILIYHGSHYHRVIPETQFAALQAYVRKKWQQAFFVKYDMAVHVDCAALPACSAR